MATRWRLSESGVCRLIHKVEALLMRSGKFRLPGKKQLYQNAYTWEVVVILIDAIGLVSKLPELRDRQLQAPPKTAAWLDSPAEFAAVE